MPERRKHRESTHKLDIDPSAYQHESEVSKGGFSETESSGSKLRPQHDHSAHNAYVRVWNPFSRLKNLQCQEPSGIRKSEIPRIDRAIHTSPRSKHHPSRSRDYEEPDGRSARDRPSSHTKNHSHHQKRHREQDSRGTLGSDRPQRSGELHHHSSKHSSRCQHGDSPIQNLYTPPQTKSAHRPFQDPVSRGHRKPEPKTNTGFARAGYGGASPPRSLSKHQPSSNQLAFREHARREARTEVEFAGRGEDGGSPSGPCSDESKNLGLAGAEDKERGAWRDAYKAMKEDGMVVSRARVKKRERRLAGLRR